jgi:hypothetical protein
MNPVEPPFTDTNSIDQVGGHAGLTLPPIQSLLRLADAALVTRVPNAHETRTSVSATVGSKPRKNPPRLNKVRPGRVLRQTPQLSEVQNIAKSMTLQEVQTLKRHFVEERKALKKMHGTKMREIASMHLYEDKHHHDHSNFAKWIQGKHGRNGRGGTNLLLLLLWTKLCSPIVYLRLHDSVSLFNKNREESSSMPNLPDFETCSL